MRFTAFHCHNPACGHRIWVAADQLGKRGRCPECAEPLQIPAEWPEDQFFEGPPILQDVEEPVPAELDSHI